MMSHRAIKTVKTHKTGTGENFEFEEVPINPEIFQRKIRGLPQVIYEISQSCNMLCSYCSYGEVKMTDDDDGVR
jgi:hypothetical protein